MTTLINEKMLIDIIELELRTQKTLAEARAAAATYLRTTFTTKNHAPDNAPFTRLAIQLTAKSFQPLAIALKNAFAPPPTTKQQQHDNNTPNRQTRRAEQSQAKQKQTLQVE